MENRGRLTLYGLWRSLYPTGLYPLIQTIVGVLYLVVVSRQLILVACKIAHEALGVLGISQQYLYRKWEEAAKLYNDIPSKRIADFTDRNPEVWSMTLSEIIPTRRISFENFEVQSAHDDIELLHRGYGDFMQLPPESERKNHYPSKLIFPNNAE